jgi:hypothetical protein
MSAVTDFINDRLREAHQRRWLGPTEGPLDGSDWAPQGISDRQDESGRHLLCPATGLHDPRPDGTCRDCGSVIGDAPACEQEPS